MNPIQYREHNQRQRKDNLQCLEENIHKIEWKGGDRIIDLGSGDGSFTALVLNKFLPEDAEQLLGVDLSPEMTHYANGNYADKRISFEQLDIRKDLPKKFIGVFDHAFSFYTLHWIFDQKKAFANIYDLLTDGGDCLLSILGNIPAFFDVNHIFVKSDKWGVWVNDLENVVSPYHGCSEPERKVRKLLIAAGFKRVEVERKKYNYTYPNIDDFKKSVKAVTAFKIPSDMFQEYLEEYVDTALQKGFLDKDLKIEYDLITVYCKK